METLKTVLLYGGVYELHSLTACVAPKDYELL
jgi:hypothetical protein